MEVVTEGPLGPATSEGGAVSLESWGPESLTTPCGEELGFETQPV